MLDQTTPLHETPTGDHTEIEIDQTDAAPPRPKRNCGRTGARTAIGKATSSRNAIRHGMCAKTLILSSETEEDWDLLFNSWLTRYQNPVENTLLFSFVIKAAQAEWFRLRAQHEVDFYIVTEGAPPMSAWPAQTVAKYDLLMRYLTAAERRFHRENRALEQHWKAHHKPEIEKATRPAAKPEPDPEPKLEDFPQLVFVNNETGEYVDVQGNLYPAPPDYKPEPIQPGVYPPDHPVSVGRLRNSLKRRR